MPASLTESQKIEIFDRLWEEYVQRHGLGGMSKTDFDALLLWKYAAITNNLDIFQLSSELKVKQTRVKSLLELASVKFAAIERHAAWHEILEEMKDVEVDVESVERGQVRFQLRKPMLFRYLQHEVRSLRSTVSYSQLSEQVIINLDVLYRILDALWEEKALGEKWSGQLLKGARANIKAAIGKIGEKIATNHLEELKSRKGSKLKSMITWGSSLSGIGSLISDLADKVQR